MPDRLQSDVCAREEPRCHYGHTERFETLAKSLSPEMSLQNCPKETNQVQIRRQTRATSFLVSLSPFLECESKDIFISFLLFYFVNNKYYS